MTVRTGNGGGHTGGLVRAPCLRHRHPAKAHKGGLGGKRRARRRCRRCRTARRRRTHRQLRHCCARPARRAPLATRRDLGSTRGRKGGGPKARRRTRNWPSGPRRPDSQQVAHHLSRAPTGGCLGRSGRSELLATRRTLTITSLRLDELNVHDTVGVQCQVVCASAKADIDVVRLLGDGTRHVNGRCDLLQDSLEGLRRISRVAYGVGRRASGHRRDDCGEVRVFLSRLRSSLPSGASGFAPPRKDPTKNASQSSGVTLTVPGGSCSGDGHPIVGDSCVADASGADGGSAASLLVLLRASRRVVPPRDVFHQLSRGADQPAG